VRVEEELHRVEDETRRGKKQLDKRLEIAQGRSEWIQSLFASRSIGGWHVVPVLFQVHATILCVEILIQYMTAINY
jgi:hypothetical protein